MGLDGNTVVASFFFLASLISDSLTAFDVRSQESVGDVPSSLRTSGIVLTLCVAAPAVVGKSWGIDGTLQFAVLFVLVLAVSILGLHQGQEGTRSADALFTLAMGGGAVYFVGKGGVDIKTLQADEKGELASKTRVGGVSIAGALLLYCNGRLFRSGLFHSAATRAFNVLGPLNDSGKSHFSTRGYAHASFMTTIALSFGAAVGIGAAGLILSRRYALARDSVKTQVHLPMLLGLCGMAQLVAAVTAQMFISEQMENLPTLFGSGSCTFSKQYCGNTLEARRFALSANNPVGSLFISSLGMFVLAFPKDARPELWEQWKGYTWPIYSVGFGFASVGSILAVFLATLTFGGEEWYIDVFGSVMILGAFVAVFADTQLGSILYLSGLLPDYYVLIHTYGWQEVSIYFTHFTHFVESAMLVIHICLTLLIDVFYKSDLLQVLVGSVTIVGMSISLALFLTSVSITVAGTTEHTVLRSNSARTSLVWMYQHYVSVFLWGALYSCRCEVATLSRFAPTGLRSSLWMLSVPLLVSIYLLLQRYYEHDFPSEYDAFEFWPMVASFSGIVAVPWVFASII